MDKNDLKKLKAPIEYKWRVQSFSSNKPLAACIPYVDSRDVQNRLDDVCTPADWQDDYKDVKGNVYAGIGIKIDGEWVWKWDCGKESAIEKEKGEASDSFKRAAVKWGIARDAYSEKIEYVQASEKKSGNNKPYPMTDNRSRIYDLTQFINDRRKNDLPEWFYEAVEWVNEGGDIEEVIKQKKPVKHIEDQLRKLCL